MGKDEAIAAVKEAVAKALASVSNAFNFTCHWDEIKEFFSNFLTELKASIAEKMHDIAHAAIIVGEKIKEGVVAIKHKLFYKEEDRWMEETTKREVIEDEVPPYIRAKIARQEADITHEMELELGMSI